MKTIYLVRHGQTLLNHFNKMQGWIDSPLTQKGQQQALATGQRLADVTFDYAASSDLGRAMQTLELIRQEAMPMGPASEQLSDLREAYFGSFEGLNSTHTWNMISRPLGYQRQADLVAEFGILKIRDFMKDTDPFHEAEAGQEVADRIHAALSYLATQLEDGQNGLVISHGTYIRTLATLLTPDQPLLKQPENGSITTIDVTDVKKPRIIKYNQ